MICRLLVCAVLAESGPQPGLAAWLTDDAPLPNVEEARQQLRDALEQEYLTAGVVHAHALPRRLTLEVGQGEIPVA